MLIRIAALCAAAAITIACINITDPSVPSGLPECSAATLMTVSPLVNADIREISPLGGLNPSGHTFPSDHGGFYIASNASGTVSALLSSPGAIRVATVDLQKRTSPGTAEFDDYGMSFFSCTTQEFYFAHIASFSSSFLAKVGSLDQGCNTPYQTGTYTFQQCYKSVDISLNPGDAIGIAGGTGLGAMDFGAIDHAQTPLAYVDPGRQTGAGGVHAACPLDYFVPNVRDALRARIAVNGVPRTIQPVCGTVMQDLANTAQGRWFFDATSQEDHHLGLVHMNGDPSIGAFSVGTSVPGVLTGVYQFTPAQSGRLNLDFNLVIADGKIYCYQPSFGVKTLYLQLETAERLRIQLGPNTTCGDPTTWSFGATSVTFDR